MLHVSYIIFYFHVSYIVQEEDLLLAQEEDLLLVQYMKHENKKYVSCTIYET